MQAHYVACMVSPYTKRVYVQSQQTRAIEPMLDHGWPAVYDVGPTLNQHWFNGSCLPGCPINQVHTGAIDVVSGC